MVNAAILISAWSAAASDIYISSRFLFFLARRGHAPTWLAHLFRYPRVNRVRSAQSDSDSDSAADSDTDSLSDGEHGMYGVHLLVAAVIDPGLDVAAGGAAESHRGHADLREDELLGMPAPVERHTYVMPLASVLASSAMGLLTFMSYGTTGANIVFQWLVNVASVASLQSWAGMLFTYIR